MKIAVLKENEMYNDRLFVNFLQKLYKAYGRGFVVAINKIFDLLKGLSIDSNYKIVEPTQFLPDGRAVWKIDYENPYTNQIEHHRLLEELRGHHECYSYEVRNDVQQVHLRILFFVFDENYIVITFSFEKYEKQAMIDNEPEHMDGNQLTNLLVSCHDEIKHNLEFQASGDVAFLS